MNMCIHIYSKYIKQLLKGEIIGDINSSQQWTGHSDSKQRNNIDQMVP
jgi:hypothetical protein